MPDQKLIDAAKARYEAATNERWGKIGLTAPAWDSLSPDVQTLWFEDDSASTD